MKAVLTGDVINSRKVETSKWLSVLKEALGEYGKPPTQWEIYRGDGFQLKIEPSRAIRTALYLKACIKQLSKLDVRIAIGIGEEEYAAEKISESNGSAYARSGEAFETIKKRKMVLSTGSNSDELWNAMLDMAMLTANDWSAAVAEAVKVALENPEKNQQQLAELVGKSQSTMSEALTRGGFEELMEMNRIFEIQTR